MRLFAVYAVASLVPLVVMGVAINVMLGREIDDRALSEAVSRAETIADATVEPVLSGADLTEGLTPTERADLVRATAALHGDAGVLRLRIRSTVGAIVFDAEHPDAPITMTVDDEVQDAAAGTPVVLLTTLNADEVDGASAEGESAVETYVAFHGPGDQRVTGVLETYLPYAPFGDAAASSKRHLSIALVIGLLALWLILGAVTWSVTRRLRRSARRNNWLARHDSLTRLPNRLRFTEQLDAHLASGRHLTVALIDIVRFRAVIDTLGHDNADEFLRSVSAAIRGALPQDVQMARLVGDQFVIAASDASPSAFHEILRGVADAAARSVQIGGLTLSAEVVVGVATSDDSRRDGTGVLQAAEFALRAAKESGISPVRYRPELDRFDPERLTLAGQLGAAIADGDLVLHYQPKLDLESGRVRSVEALVRWQHPTRGLLQPVDFISIAESTSLIRPLTEWVVREAVRQIGEWRARDCGVSVSVNVSARSLVDDDLPSFLLGVLAASSVPANQLEVEVTETAIVADPVRAKELLDQLHEGGVRISLDDFGQGATSLLSLANLPLDELKVDRGFVVGMEQSDEKRAVVEFVISLGHRLGLTVVAEGIETEAAAATLATMGCDQGQGYLFSRPVPAEHLESWLIHHHGVTAARERSAGVVAAGSLAGVDGAHGRR